MDDMENYGAHLRAKVLEAENKKMRAALADSDAILVAQLAATLCGGALAIGKFPDAADAIAFSRDLLAESRRQAAAPAGGRSDG